LSDTIVPKSFKPVDFGQVAINNTCKGSSWSYVDSKSNPADNASKCVTLQELLCSTWFSGPSVIESQRCGLHDNDNELKSNIHVIFSDSSFGFDSNLSDTFSKFSDGRTSLRVVASESHFEKP
jgi:hypothetical protein